MTALGRHAGVGGAPRKSHLSIEMILKRDGILVVGGEDMMTHKILDDVFVRMRGRSRCAMHKGCRRQQCRVSSIP